VLPAFYAYLLPALLLGSVPFFVMGDPLNVTIGVMMLLYVGYTSRFALGLSRTIVEFVKLRFENEGLVRELRSQKEAAEMAKEAADDANVAKSRFLAAASHDLRQPLHALGFFVENLQHYSLPEDGRNVVLNIRRSVAAMDDLFDSLLDISRLDAGIVQPHVTTVSLGVLFERIRAEYEPFAQRRGITLRVAKTRAFVRSDPALLERIIRNLLTNAVRYTDQGGVVLGCRRSGDRLRIEVWDSGRGIPAQRHREIFLEFIQLENPERDRRKGLGLGLAIVERLSKLLDHAIEMRSAPGKGSMFAVSVPRGWQADYAPAEPAAAIASEFDFADLLVLVIDDEAAVRESMAALLGRWGCQVIAAGSQAEILEQLARLPRAADLIVSDYRLRGEENGAALVKVLREQFNDDIPALLLTGDTDPSRLREAEASGLPILHKPLSPARLRALIASLLRERVRAA
jgi:two-component system, sensor histidine kinase